MAEVVLYQYTKGTVGLVLKFTRPGGAEEGIRRTWWCPAPPGTPGGHTPDAYRILIFGSTNKTGVYKLMMMEL